MKCLLSLLVACFLFSSCRHDNGVQPDNNPHATGAILQNTWYAHQTSYHSNVVTVNGLTIKGVGTSGTSNSTLIITFGGSALPTASQTFKVVSGAPSANEVTVNILDATGNYFSTGNDNIYLSFKSYSYNNSHDVYLPKVWVKNAATTDSIQVSGSLDY